MTPLTNLETAVQYVCCVTVMFSGTSMKCVVALFGQTSAKGETKKKILFFFTKAVLTSLGQSKTAQIIAH
jgi:hypothetical protein